MGPLGSYRAGTWLIDECQIAFFTSCLMLRNLDHPFLSLFSLSFVLLSTICLVSWIPRIPVLCSPDCDWDYLWLPVILINQWLWSNSTVYSHWFCYISSKSLYKSCSICCKQVCQDSQLSFSHRVRKPKLL